MQNIDTIIEIERVNKDIILPNVKGLYKSDLEIYANVDFNILPGNICTFKTGLKFYIQSGYELQIKPIGNNATKGLLLCNSSETIDFNYKEELKLTLYNMNHVYIYNIKKDTKIAILTLYKSLSCCWKERF